MKYILEIAKDKRYSKPIITLLFMIIFIIMYIDYEPTKLETKNNITIEVTKAAATDAPVYLSGLGTAIPTHSANIQPQVTGQILDIIFKDGQLVKKDDLLIEIDASIYKAQVSQYQGQLETNKALLNNALIDLKRYQDLAKDSSISEQILATQVSLVEQYKGAIKSTQGLLDVTKANLDYCKIKAPFDGKIGINLITKGNIVNSSSTIAILNSLSPISVLFTVPEANLQELLAMNSKEPIIIEAYDSLKKNIISSGHLVAIDNQINPSTGTIQLKGEFSNDDYRLFPNQFINVRLLLKTLKNIISVPISAVQYGPNGAFVYVIENSIAHVNPVVIDHLSEGQAIISSGISKDQLIATIGTDKLSDNAAVDISNK